MLMMLPVLVLGKIICRIGSRQQAARGAPKKNKIESDVYLADE
jgi:hypothetical protein